jgi:hypothetical protein
MAHDGWRLAGVGTMKQPCRFVENSPKKTNLFLPDVVAAVDAKTRHSTFYKLVSEHTSSGNVSYLPLSALGPGDFSVNVAQQLSK